MNQFNARIKMKRDSEENWNQNNPILLNGEIALVEKQEGIELKIGDGEKQFKEVSYYFPPPSYWDKVFPVNRIVMFYDNLDHSDYLGLKWERCLGGRVPVGIDSNDLDFNTIGNQIGEKEHTLTSSEVPSLNTGTQSVGIHSSEPLVTSYGNSGAPHNNIQPSEVIAYWRRIE